MKLLCLGLVLPLLSAGLVYGSPYAGQAAVIPGVIEAEFFDTGGEGVGYHAKKNPGGSGPEFRTDEGPYIVEMDDDPGNYVIGAIVNDEWLRYTVDVSEDVDRFDFKFLVTSGSHTGSVRVVAGATDESDPCGTYQLDLSGKLTGFPGTSGSRTGATSKEFDTTTGVAVDGLPAGPAVVWLCIISTRLNVDSFELLLPPPPVTTNCTKLNDPVCPTGQTCCVDKMACEDQELFNSVACGDPHMIGFRGQKFDFTGVDGSWYCLIKDSPRMHISMRVSATVPEVPQITYITGLALRVTDAEGIDHTIVIEVKDPHNLDSACPEGLFPCLADGSLSVVLDGEEVLAAPGTYPLAPGVQITAANLPGACRSFGFEKYWERKKLESQVAGRMLDDRQQSMGAWILGDPTATNMDECTQYVTAKAQDEEDGGEGVFAHQSEHASFMIVTPDASIRLSHGRLHQLAMRDPTDQFDLPDHRTWQMNFAVDHRDVGRHAKGILGETFVPTLDTAGNRVMHGMESIRGTEEDYRVKGPLGTAFSQDKPSAD